MASARGIAGSSRGLTTLLTRISGVVSLAQAIASSIDLVECGSLNTWAMKNVSQSW